MNILAFQKSVIQCISKLPLGVVITKGLEECGYLGDEMHLHVLNLNDDVSQSSS